MDTNLMTSSIEMKNMLQMTLEHMIEHSMDQMVEIVLFKF